MQVSGEIIFTKQRRIITSSKYDNGLKLTYRNISERALEAKFLNLLLCHTNDDLISEISDLKFHTKLKLRV